MLFGTTQSGQAVEALTLKTDEAEVTLLTLGAIVQAFRVPGVDYSLTLGATHVDAYEGTMFSFGSLMGPVANRIKDAQADIDGETYTFEAQTPEGHTLHMGDHGLHAKVFEVSEARPDQVVMTLKLPHMDGGLPGDREITVTYTLVGATLTMEIAATSDRPTLFNIANHNYWNLDGTPTYAGHRLTVPALHYLPTNDDTVPTGEVAEVDGTTFDFRNGKLLTADSTQFWDHNLCLSQDRQPIRPVARLEGTSGLTLDMASTETGLQVYDGGTIAPNAYDTLHGAPYGLYAATALEAQSWPGATSHAHFPSIVHGPDRPYHQVTSWTIGRKG